MSTAEAAPDPKPSRASGLLGLVRQLIDYGRQLAATLRRNPHPFGTSDIALILAHITRGLLRAVALEARIIRNAARLDAEPVPPRAASQRQSPPTRSAAAHPTDTAASGEARHLPAHARADRRRGPPPPDRRRHRRHLPRSRHQAEPSVVAGTAQRHRPLWRQPGQAGEGHLRLRVSESRLALAAQLTSRAGPAIPGTFRHRPALISGARTAAASRTGPVTASPAVPIPPRPSPQLQPVEPRTGQSPRLWWRLRRQAIRWRTHRVARQTAGCHATQCAVQAVDLAYWGASP